MFNASPLRPWLALAAGACLAFAAPTPAAAQIQVSVDGRPVQFGAVQPARVSGRVLIPLRAVVESLGADVRWEPATRTVRGSRGSREFSLQIGSRNALVDGSGVSLDVPAQLISGTTMVPLRFVAEALGAEVEWNAAAQQVLIATGDAAPPDSPAVPGRVSGEVVAVRPDDNPPTLTLRVDGVRRTYEVRRDTIVLRGTEGQRGAAVDLSQLRVGDQARLRTDPAGRAAETVEATARAAAPAPPAAGRRVEGEVLAVRPRGNPPSITVRAGGNRITYDVTPDTLLLRAVGTRPATRVDLEEIQPGDRVQLRVDASGAVATLVEAAAPVIEPAPARDVRISSFSVDAEGILRAGATVRAALLGSAGGTASLDVGNIARSVPLREDPGRPGHYSGAFTIPRGVTARGVPVIAQLQVGDKTAPLVQAGTLLQIDSEAPTLSEVSPASRSEVASVRPDIYVEVSDGAGSGVDRNQLRVIVRGRDVTDSVKMTPRFLLYTPPQDLAPGDVPVTIQVRDMAGNQAETSWTFTIRPASAGVKSVSHDADRPLKAGDLVTVTVQGIAGGQGTFSIGDAAKAVPLREVSPGMYRGTYTVQASDPALKAPVKVELVAPDGKRATAESTAPVSLITGELKAPRITAPVERFRLQDELVVTGTGEPGTRVMVEVTYSGKAFGALPVRGTFGSQEALVDKDGQWKTAPFPVRLGLGVRRPELTIQAVAVDAAGRESKPAVVEVETR